MAAAVAKPQYGSQQSVAPSFMGNHQSSASHGSWEPMGASQHSVGGGAPAVTPEQWASLSPYGSDINAYPAEERPRIEEIQRQWMSFLEYLPWLTVPNFLNEFFFYLYI